MLPDTPARNSSHTPLFITLTFIALSAVWIVLTDKLLAAFSLRPSVAEVWSIAKGSIYVLFTAWVLYRVLIRKASEERLRREYEIAAAQFDTLESFISNAPAALAMFDRHMRCVQASDRWCKDYGLEKSEIIGRSHYDVFPTLPKRWREAHQRGMAGEVLRSDGDAFIARDGNNHEVRWEVQPWRHSTGEVGGILIYTDDVTEQRALENQYRQAQKMEAVGHLAGGVAHDFNNFLTVVLSCAELIGIAPDTPPKAAQRANTIVETAKKAAKVTSQLLAFSRHQHRQLHLLNLNQVVTGFGRMLPDFIHEDIEMSLREAPGDALVYADQGQIEQVLMNLVVNAQDAMPRGGRLSIEVDVVQLDGASVVNCSAGRVPPGEYVKLSVSDTGCGMDESTRLHAFEPFFTTKAGKGTGLGLATVYGIVRQSKGSIALTTAVDHGTRFDIYLPRAEAPSVSEAEQPIPDRALRPVHVTLLLVEDQPDVRSVLGDYMASRGYEVLIADSAEAALQTAVERASPIHILLTDVVMPRMRGPELAKRLVPIHPETKAIFMSGYADCGEDEDELRNATLIQKPMDFALLDETIRLKLG